MSARRRPQHFGHRHAPGGGCCAAAPPDDAARIAELARDRFRLAPSTPVRVVEAPTTIRGFPPIETVISFWTGNQNEHRWTVFKPARTVAVTDLPPWWMKGAIAVDDFPFCDCCG